MPLFSPFRIMLVGFAFASSGALAAVTVSHAEAGRYSDAGDRGQANRTVDEIKRHLELLGERYLLPSQNLKIEIVDIDLAGRLRYSARRGEEIRVLDGGADWPSMKLRYTLESDGKVIDSREETVSDMSYLLKPAPSGSGALYYEKRMLDDWFRQRFVEGRRPPR
jgi:DUF3016 family protein